MDGVCDLLQYLRNSFLHPAKSCTSFSVFILFQLINYVFLTPLCLDKWKQNLREIRIASPCVCHEKNISIYH